MNSNTEKNHSLRIYMWVVVAVGLAAFLLALNGMTNAPVSVSYLLLLCFTILLGSRATVEIEQFKTNITVTDVIIFLTMFLYDGEAAVVLAATEAFFTSFRYTKTFRFRAFNAATMACSISVTIWLLRYLFGPLETLLSFRSSPKILLVICVMVVSHYIANASLISAATAMRQKKPFFQTWKEYYLWIILAYFAAASVAILLTPLTHWLGPVTVIIASPIIASVYFTYSTYNKNVQAAAEKAAQAQRHIAELQQSEERFRSAFAHAPIGMGLVAPDGRWLQVNHTLCKILNYSETQLLETNFQSLIHPDDLIITLTQVGRLLQGGIEVYQTESRYYRSDGQEVWVMTGISRTFDSEQQNFSLIFQIQDITDKKRAETQLLYDAFHDALTGLANRALLTDHIKLAIERARNDEDSFFAILFIDLDRFKLINDSVGHSAGDELLQEIAKRLKKCVRPTDTVARLGGDEFVILVENTKDVAEVVDLTNRIQNKLQKKLFLRGQEAIPTASIGITFYNESYDKPEEILRDADIAMYSAKALGKAKYSIFNKEMHARILKNLELEAALRQAIEQKEFFLVYQPIISLSENRLAGFEALVRWQHPQRGLISPLEFIPIAEDMGFINRIGQMVLEEACYQMRQWQNAFALSSPLVISVNVSGKQFSQDNLADNILRILEQSKLDPSQLKLEITESVVMENFSEANDMLQKLRSIGIRMSIDDFGTGYSSLSYLHALPVDTLKIDRSFVMQMSKANENTEIVRTIIMLAKNLGMDVVAEGIETEDQLNQLRRLGCDYGQGYFFAKPLTHEDATSYIAKMSHVTAIAPLVSEITMHLGDVEPTVTNYTM